MNEIIKRLKSKTGKALTKITKEANKEVEEDAEYEVHSFLEDVIFINISKYFPFTHTTLIANTLWTV